MWTNHRLGLVALLGVLTPAAAGAQAPELSGLQAMSAGVQQPAPAALPPADSPPLVRFIEIAFPAQGNVSVVDPQTYQFYIQTQPSRSSDGTWVPYDESTVLDDFQRLWNTNFLDDLWIDVQDVPYENGVIGKHIIFNLEERQRVKVVDYEGNEEVEDDKFAEKLAEEGALIRLDSFIDPAQVQRVEGLIREVLAVEGYQLATVTHRIASIPGGPKLVNLTFVIDEGPKVKIREIDFVGNTEIDDGKLKGKMKEIKERYWLSFITGRGTYEEAKFEEDAERVVGYYREKGYITATVGQPQLEYLEDSDDGSARWVRLKIPVSEGRRYRVGDVNVEGNTVLQANVLRPLFKLEPGEFYSEKDVREGLEKAQEIYGAAGYFEFTAFPDLKPRDMDASGIPGTLLSEPAVVDVTMRFQEGKQYFVNRITFEGNDTTRDQVIRRELRLVENGIFNAEALKSSIRRLNQLGYFEALEQDAVAIDKLPGDEAKLDVRLRLKEQNRNQLTFGAGVSQFEGFFGQLSFQTANFMGRGETLNLALQAGSRSQNYQLSFVEPFLFDRPITGGLDLFKREIRYPSQFTQSSTGGGITFGYRVAGFTQLFVNYSYEKAEVTELNELFTDPRVLASNPFLQDSLLIGQGGKRTISKISPRLVHNTVDHPIFPSTGRRYSVGVEMAGAGGNTSFINPSLEGVWYLQQSSWATLGFRTQFEYIRPYGSTTQLPIFEKLFLGGEYSVRGFDIRSIGPRDEVTGLVLGGNKSLLFNGEYILSVGGPVRLVLFYDAGQVRDQGDDFAMDQFKTSTGVEVRFFMPVLNVPFRLIFAQNPQRDGVLDNSLQPQKAFSFRFAVGSTF